MALVDGAIYMLSSEALLCWSTQVSVFALSSNCQTNLLFSRQALAMMSIILYIYIHIYNNNAGLNYNLVAYHMLFCINTPEVVTTMVLNLLLPVFAV